MGGTMARSRALLAAVVGTAALFAAPAAQADIGVGAGSDGLVAPTAARAPAAKQARSTQADNGGGHGKFQPGAPGIGDPYFPLEGNGGYDPQHYAPRFSYDPATDRLQGVPVLTARPTPDPAGFGPDPPQLRGPSRPRTRPAPRLRP